MPAIRPLAMPDGSWNGWGKVRWILVPVRNETVAADWPPSPVILEPAGPLRVVGNATIRMG